MRAARRIVVPLLAVVLVAALAWSFWPPAAALYVRYAYTGEGANAQQLLGRYVPDDVGSRLDVAYGEGDDERLDVHRPAGADGPLPTVVWVHGGGWVGGDKKDVAPYLKILAAEGYAVVGVNYSRAPFTQYPTPTVQTNRALGWLVDHADDVGIDPDRVVLAGDSAGAQVAAQVATLTTSPAYAEEMGIRPALRPAALRGAVLACGAFDPVAMMGDGHLGTMTVRSYLGDTDRTGPQARVADHVTGRFPPSFVTVGNADPLEPQSRELAARLADQDVDVSTLFYPGDHRPLGHEYQFNLAAAEGQRALRETVAFLAVTTAE